MKKIIFLTVASFLTVAAFCQTKNQVVEAACGQCQFGLPGKSCDLAIRINGKAYFVDGSKIDSHGDAHAKDGFCNAIRKAEVSGELVKGRFKATHFELMPEKGNANK
jgi:hypothetical protein